MGSCLSVNSHAWNEVHCHPGPRKSRKECKQIMEVLTAEARSNELLSRISGRMCNNGASGTASIFTQQGRKGTNQDAMIVWENFASRRDCVFCGVFDGHGPYGHLVAKKARDSLPSKIMLQWKACSRGDVMNTGSTVEGDYSKDPPNGVDTEEPEMFKAWKASFLKAYNIMDNELRMHPAIDCFCSGTTAVTMLLQGQELIIGNLGDSRAVLATIADDGIVEAVQLTVDLKPDLPKEAERIRMCRGRVSALQDEPDVHRVWLPDDDSPGLAMARAFGDFCLKDFGLIAVPEITYRRITERDQFIVLATDGVWDVLSNKEVVEVVSEAPTRTTAARALVETSVRGWKLKYPTSKVDDCAVVCLFLNQIPPISAAQLQHQRVNRDTLNHINSKMSAASEENEASEGDATKQQQQQQQPVEDSSVDSPDLEQSKTDNVERRATSREGQRGIFKEKIVERSQSRRSLGDCLCVEEEEEWCALEGITRVNSLLHLPRHAQQQSSRQWHPAVAPASTV